MFGKSYTESDTTTPVPGGWTRVTGNSANASPYSKTQAITTTTGDMTDEAICAALNFSQCVTSAGFQTEDQSLNDSNSTKCRSGHLAGAGSSVTHSYDLTADASGRIAYILYANIVQGAGGGGGAQGAGTLAENGRASRQADEAHGGITQGDGRISGTSSAASRSPLSGRLRRGRASITRATNGKVSVYRDGNVTQSTAGITDTEDFDGVTGIHLVRHRHQRPPTNFPRAATTPSCECR